MTILDGLLSELILPTDNVEAPFHWYQLVRFANLRSPGFRGSVRSLAEFVHRLTVCLDRYKNSQLNYRRRLRSPNFVRPNS